MSRRLIEPLERWVLEWPLWALALALAWRLAAGVLLWGGLRLAWPPAGIIESQLLGLLAAAAVLGLIRCLVPRDYAAAAGLLGGGTAALLCAAVVPRYGWLLPWRLGGLEPGWYIATGLLAAAALLANIWLAGVWHRQLRGHGIEWTRRWAQDKPFAARQLALRALRMMGDGETA